MQVTCDHFSSFWAWQQQSKEEALRMARETHCWVLAAAEMLEWHIKWLNCSVSHGWHQSHGHSNSCQHSGSIWHSRSRRCSSCRGQTALPADCLENPGRRWAALPSPVRPKRLVTFKDPKDTKVKQTSPPTTPNRWNLETTGSWPWSWAEGPNNTPQSWTHVSKNSYLGPGHLVGMGMSSTDLQCPNHPLTTCRSGSGGVPIG